MKNGIIFQYALHGDATRDETLQEAAGIDKAAALMAALPDDADNLFCGALTARELNKRIKIISRAAYDTSVKKLKTAGLIT
ncbi:MAG: NAD-binding protein [Bacteroidetes bacterium]|nr:NAD-binding protein [Bacteroidota bacterium]